MIKLKTSEGDITLSLFVDKAPETTKNFLYYAKNGDYKGTIFHRVIKNFMIQGGGHLPDMSQISTIDPIVNESNNNISNKKGTIAMARTSDPHSATSQFFINLIDNSFLDKENAPDDFGYCVFGEVVEGIEIVEKIGHTATGNKLGYSDVPLENIIIEDVEIIKE
ncbi:MAG: peptidylprolyl isomerase [Gammaproteobacteria bacterium]|nr:peptidylprolyl isomerase [Gammaproteobacteria bacterium]